MESQESKGGLGGERDGTDLVNKNTTDFNNKNADGNMLERSPLT